MHVSPKLHIICPLMALHLLLFVVSMATMVTSNVGTVEGFYGRNGYGYGYGHGRNGYGYGHGHDDDDHGVAAIVTEELYKNMFKHKDDPDCLAKGFYDYSSFIQAAGTFPRFGNTGDLSTRKREIAAFFAQISHETTGGWPDAPDGPYAWGLCFKEELKPPGNYCDPTVTEWPCRLGKSYHGRGPIQLSWNYNYGPAGRELGFDGLSDPELVSNNSLVAYKTALWFWMTPRQPKPSCHDVMVGEYRPTVADVAVNRTAGFGLTTNIINGGLECGRPGNAQVEDRIGFYRTYSQLLAVDVGPNLDCAYQQPY